MKKPYNLPNNSNTRTFLLDHLVDVMMQSNQTDSNIPDSKQTTLRINQDEPLSIKSFQSWFENGVKLLDEGKAEDALELLDSLQTHLKRLDVVSMSSDSYADIATLHLPFLALHYHLGLAHLQQRTTRRKPHLTKARDFFEAYLRNLDTLMTRSEETSYRESGVMLDYRKLISILDRLEDQEEGKSLSRLMSLESRDEKVTRFKRKRLLEQQIERLKSKEEDLDEEALREVYTQQLLVYAMIAIDECLGIPREMAMLQMADQNQPTIIEEGPEHNSKSFSAPRRPQHLGGMQMTNITQDPVTGQLIFRKEQLQKEVFRPSWNLPTMTLAELGDRERAAALERAEQQRIAEAQPRPKRYDQLVKEGLEDNDDLVDASAKLDREWDDFKDANPRGSGNKMGDRGDRNF